MSIGGKAGTAENAGGSDGKPAAITGKILPVALEGLPFVGVALPTGENPVPGELAGEAAPVQSTDSETILPVLVPLPVVQPVASDLVIIGEKSASPLQLPATLPLAAQPSGEAAPDAGTKGEIAKPAQQPGVAIQIAPMPAAEVRGTQDAPAVTAEKLTADLTKPQPNSSSADRSAQRDPAGGERPAPDVATKLPGKVAIESAPVQPTGAAPSIATPGAPAGPAIDPAQPHVADKPAVEAQMVRELSRIIDSLATAREALTSKAATLAIDHAEFGELSLRFDQRKDGQLAVQLAASDPDAHRAVAAAIADRTAYAQADSGISGGQQNAQAGGSASSRGSHADHESGSTEGNPARDERRERSRDAKHDNSRKGKTGDGRSAIYA